MSAHNANKEMHDSPLELKDPGDGGLIRIERYATHVDLVTAGAETRTLARPSKAGLRCVLNFQTDGGNCVVTSLAQLNSTGNNTITFATAGQMLELHSRRLGSDLEWTVVYNEGTTGLSTV